MVRGQRPSISARAVSPYRGRSWHGGVDRIRSAGEVPTADASRRISRLVNQRQFRHLDRRARGQPRVELLLEARRVFDEFSGQFGATVSADARSLAYEELLIAEGSD